MEKEGEGIGRREDATDKIWPIQMPQLLLTLLLGKGCWEGGQEQG